jgi:hypothetical protein
MHRPPCSVNFSISGTATEGDDIHSQREQSGHDSRRTKLSSHYVDANLTTLFLASLAKRLSLTITAGTGYNEFGAPATATIEDNDNHEPVVHAGVDRQAVLGDACVVTC